MTASTGGPRWGFASSIPVGVHAAGLLLVLLLLFPVVGTRGVFSSDEGATLLTARRLAEGSGWIIDHPVPAADPTMKHYPFATYEAGVDGRSPYAKHPLHVLVLAGAYRVGGHVAVVLFSCLAVVAAAGAAAALSRLIAAGHQRTALWATGVGTPLLFDAYLVMGHAAGAALTAAALVAAVAAERRPWLVLWVAPALIAAALIRSEAVLFALALGGVLLGVAVLRPTSRGVRAAGAALAIGAAVAVRIIEPLIVNAVLGGGDRTGAAGVPVEAGSRGFVRDRLDGATHSLLGIPDGEVRLAIGLLLATAVAGALFLRSRPDPGLALAILGLAAIGAVVRVAVGGGGDVTGLLPASPLLVAGVILLRCADLRSWCVPVATSLTFAALVCATQYRVGGGSEWGGRYFAPAVPLLVPVAVAAVARWATSSPPMAVRRGAVALGLVVATVSGSALAELRSSRRLSQAFVDRVMTVVAEQPEPRPVVVATQPALPRFAWEDFEAARWLLAEEQEVTSFAGDLRAAGIERFLLVAVVGPGKPEVDVPGFRVHRLVPPKGLPYLRVYEVTSA